jgi:hypothetical protein
MLGCFVIGCSALSSNSHATPSDTVLHNQDVLDLLKAGLSPEVVVAKIASSETAFDTSAASLKELKGANVPETVILAMVKASAPKSMQAPVTDSFPGDEYGHLKVYRQHRYMGSGLAPSIWVNKVQVARVGSGRHCSIRLHPGIYEIRSDDKSSLITLTVERGKEYYIRVDEEPGVWKGHGKLTLITVEQGSGEYKLQKPIEKDRRIAKDMLEGDSAPDSAE